MRQVKSRAVNKKIKKIIKNIFILKYTFCCYVGYLNTGKY